MFRLFNKVSMSLDKVDWPAFFNSLFIPSYFKANADNISCFFLISPFNENLLYSSNFGASSEFISHNADIFSEFSKKN